MFLTVKSALVFEAFHVLTKLSVESTALSYVSHNKVPSGWIVPVSGMCVTVMGCYFALSVWLRQPLCLLAQWL